MAVHNYNDDGESTVFSNANGVPRRGQCVGRENSDVNRTQEAFQDKTKPQIREITLQWSLIVL